VDKDPIRIIVIGGSGAIGQALVQELLDRFPLTQVHATYHHSAIPQNDERIQWHQLDVRDPEQITSFSNEFDHVDWIINCAGYLHGEHGGPEKSIKSIDADFLIENIRINTLPTLQLAKNFSVALKKSTAPILATVSARVGSIEDNRLGGWYSYRISKAALNMALKTLSIEWKHSHPKGCVAALHPGTNDSPLSKPFQANVAPQNLFTPAYTVSCFVKLLTRLDSRNSGKFWAWNETIIPW
jgi:NAD(P)-dependent dehydrogenase (short-subunit alcohol dehydrogenase family)